MNQKQVTIVVAVISNEKGELLLGQRHEPESPEIHGKWEFVGGSINFGEDPETAIVREIAEEIGVQVEVVRLLPKIISDQQTFTSGDQLQVIVLSYECKIISGEPTPNLEENIGELQYFALEEIEKLNAFQNIHDTVKLLKKITQ